jgi:hypothetical protein
MDLTPFAPDFAVLLGAIARSLRLSMEVSMIGAPPISRTIPPRTIPMRNTAAAIPALLAVVLLSAHGAQAQKVSEPFSGKDLNGWKFKGDDPSKSKWQVGTGKLNASNPNELVVESGGKEMVNLLTAGVHGVDIFTEEKWGDVLVEVEVMIPKGSNSGIYLMGEYEVQVLDSFGKQQVGPGDMGGIYETAPPKVNACKPAGEWQKFVIDFRAPKFDASGNKTQPAKFVKVTLNDQVLHENVDVKGPTTACLTGKEAPTGPLMFQGDHGPVAYRNIKVTTVEEKK